MWRETMRPVQEQRETTKCQANELFANLQLAEGPSMVLTNLKKSPSIQLANLQLGDEDDEVLPLVVCVKPSW